MKTRLLKTVALWAVTSSSIAMASCGNSTFDLSRLGQAALSATQAFTLTNDQLASYVHESVAYMDEQNQVAPASSAYTQRLNKLTKGMTKVGNTPLNFKVYITKDVNAFACADGSVRVYSGIMDLLTDDELMGIIGHEVGHVALEHSKNAFKQELMNEALLNAIASTSSTAAALTDSQLGALANSLMSSKFSRKQENEADAYGYNFLKEHNRNPYNMVKAFEKMQQLEGTSSGASSYFQKMFSTHPETTERIKRIKQMCERDGYTK